MEVTGTLKTKFDTQKVSERFQKREFILTTEASTPYPQFLSFQITQDKVSILDQYHEGEELKVQFNLRGREWNGPNGVKYFNTLEAWRIEKSTGNSGSPSSGHQSQQASSNESAPPPVFTSDAGDNDDLPF